MLMCISTLESRAVPKNRREIGRPRRLAEMHYCGYDLGLAQQHHTKVQTFSAFHFPGRLGVAW